MRSTPRLALVLAALLTMGVVVTVVARQQAARSQVQTATSAPAETTARIVAAAQALLTTLDDAGRATVQFPFAGPQTTRWSNLPSPMFERRGLRLADLTEPQRAAVMNLLTTALSRDGYQKVLNIMEGDEVLRQGGGGGGGGRGFGRGGPGGPGGRGGPAFGRDRYYLAFLGTPSTTQPWMLQYGGHHLAINLTIGGSEVKHDAQPAGGAARHLHGRGTHGAPAR